MPKVPKQNTETIEDSPYWSIGPQGKNPTCLVCPSRNGKPMVFETMKKALNHAALQSHRLKRDLHDYRQGAMSKSQSSRATGKQPMTQSTVTSSTGPHHLSSYPLATDPRPFDSYDQLDSPSLPINPSNDGSNQENLSSSFARLWKDRRQGTPFAAAFGSSAVQIHEQLQERMARGERLFSSTLSFDGIDEIPQEVDPLGVDSGSPPEADPFTFPTSNLPGTGDFDSSLFPWPSRSIALTELLFSSPRLRFSEAQKKAVLAWARELGARDVPTLRTLKKAQDAVLSDIGSPTRQCVSTNGNTFYINDVAKAIAMDYANPLTRPKMEDYPILLGTSMSQVWNGRKMLLDLPPHLATPTARNAGKIFWVNELTQLVDHSYFIPSRFFYLVNEGDRSKRVLMALGWKVVCEQDLWNVVEGLSEPQVEVSVSSFYRSYLDIQSNADEMLRGFDRSSEMFAKAMPHPFRKVAGNRMVYSVPLILFEDDVSGNISKQWNKHYVVYASNANLPRDMLEKEFCVRFVTSSPNAVPMELMQGVKESITKAWEAGVPAFDCENVEEVVLRPYALLFPGDNPMQAEHCSQAGLGCNYFCRSCKVGGKRVFKETDEGFSTLFQPGAPRTTEDTKAAINNTLQLSLVSGAEKKVEEAVASHGTRDHLTSSAVATVVKLGKALRKRVKGVKNASEAAITAKLKHELKQRAPEINPLLDMPGVDIHKDTPTEILHTVLLGVVKYFWQQTIVLLKKSHSMDIFEARLASINSEGLNIPKISAKYMCAYSGSLIGKHFKTIAQVMPFIVYDLVPKDVLQAWQAIGDLVVLLWHTEIPDVGKYIQELRTAIDNFLHLAAKCAPSILIAKPKFHFLVHLPEFIERFGPAIIFSTERYESFNSVFRLTCIHSNRQAPSRDSCQRMAYVDIMKHIVTGGFWYSEAHQQWVKAGHAVSELFNNVPELISLLAIPTDPLPFVTGTATLYPSPKEPEKAASAPVVLFDMQQGLRSAEGQALFSTLPGSVTAGGQATDTLATTYHRAKSFIMKSGEKAVVGSHVIYSCASSAGSDNAGNSGKEYESVKSIGRVIEICVPNDGTWIASWIVVERMGFLGTRHPVLDLPCLELTGQQETIIPDTAVCLVNLQHDCQSSGCEDFVYRQVLQERLQSQLKQAIVDHKPTALFILNTHSLHNYRQINDIVPEHLRGSSFNLGDLALLRKAAAQQIRRDKQKAAEAKEQGEGVSESDIGGDTSEDAMRADTADPVLSLAFSRKKGKRTLQKRKKKYVSKRSSKGAPAFGTLELGNSSEGSELSPESEEQHDAY